MTPRSCLDFAAKLRTNLTPSERKVQVDNVIQRLGLGGCQDTQVGGMSIKGISGGERKRTSIGYELITDPNIILLDEPTSGLDSSTALKIV
jgi:ABC-type multidrug transport system ATPase subunit